MTLDRWFNWILVKFTYIEGQINIARMTIIPKFLYYNSSAMLTNLTNSYHSSGKTQKLNYYVICLMREWGPTSQSQMVLYRLSITYVCSLFGDWNINERIKTILKNTVSVWHAAFRAPACLSQSISIWHVEE